ncbi:MAG: ATP-binding protein, partial [Bacteroidetes bacterium]|nr:ATP-binding protein [Bacteroidota bacterium]
LQDIAASNGSIIVNSISHDDIIQSDENILSIILHNIVSNAIKFTMNGKIEFSSADNSADYIVKIEDNGSGIAEEQLTRIRKILNKEIIPQPEMSAGKHGFGLGYIIISDLSALLNITVELKSKQDEGTTVILKIPR